MAVRRRRRGGGSHAASVRPRPPMAARVGCKDASVSWMAQAFSKSTVAGATTPTKKRASAWLNNVMEPGTGGPTMARRRPGGYLYPRCGLRKGRWWKRYSREKACMSSPRVGIRRLPWGSTARRRPSIACAPPQSSNPQGTLPNTTQALWPPKPKELESTRA